MRMNFYYELVKYDKNIPGKILMQDKPGWRCNTFPHWHPELEFVYMINGSLRVTINGNEQIIKNGEFYFCNTKIIHSTFTFDNVSTHKYIVLLLSYDFLLRFHDVCTFHINKEDAYHKIKAQLEYLASLSEQSAHETYAKNLDIEKNKCILEICQILLTECVVSDSNVSSNLSTFTGYAKTIMEYIGENYNQKLTLQAIANEIGLSPQYLSKYFKKATNMGLLQYINLIRLEHANNYLINSGSSITDTALSSGFSNVKTYVRLCKNVYGMTPSEYRKSIHASGTSGL